MIPYIHISDFHIGPLPLRPFGILVATGVLIGTAVTTRGARALGCDLDALNSFVTWMLVSGFVLAHMLDMFSYGKHSLLGVDVAAWNLRLQRQY